jgi:hypothetical protein
MLSALAVLVVLWGLLVGPALASDPCRQAVVIYLDVSGSMYEQKYMSTPAWANSRKVTLMENTVRFLENGLLAPGSLAVNPGDTVTLCGFYSQVDNLAGPIHGFNPEADAARLGKEIGKRLDFNGNNEYDIGDALPDHKRKTTTNTFLALRPAKAAKGKTATREYALETDFVNVVADMTLKFEETPLGPGGPQDFDKLVFIILTDGGQENEETQERFKEQIKIAGDKMGEKIQQGRVQVHFFGVVAGDRGAYLELKERQDVTPFFKQHLQATAVRLNMREADQPWINARLASQAERIEIQRVHGASYKHPDPPAPDAPPRATAPSGKILVPLTLKNHACRGLVAQEVRCVISQSAAEPSGKAGSPEGDRTPLDTLVCPVGEELGKATSDRNYKNLNLTFNRRLEPGRYQLEMTVTTKDLGQGLRPKAVVNLEVPEAPPEPGEPANIARILVVTALLGAGLFILVHQLRRPRGKGANKA